MALAVDQLSLGQIGTNCYLVRADRDATEVVVVDPGADATEIRLALARSGASCSAILLTHSHYDHFGALADLAEGTGAPVWLPEGELDVFRRPDLFFPGIVDPAVLGRSDAPHRRRDGRLRPGSRSRSAVPGHSPGHVSYYADGCLFSGDVLFSGSVGRTDLPFGDWETLLESIRALADAYPPETIVYSGHGPATTLGDELARNPFLAELRADPKIERPRGTHDILPSEQPLWRRVTGEMERLAPSTATGRSRRRCSRTRSCSCARRARARTWCRRRCTPSPTAPTAR